MPSQQVRSLFSSHFVLIMLNVCNLFQGFTKKEAGLLVAVSAALDLVGRLGFGYLCDLQIFDRKKAFVVWYVKWNENSID